MKITPSILGCHTGCRVFGQTGVTLTRDDDNPDLWTVAIPDRLSETFTNRPEAYVRALSAAYRLSTLDNLENL